MSPKWRKLESINRIKNNHWSVVMNHGRGQRFLALAGNRAALILLIIANITVGFAYLMQTNLTASAGYEISGWERKVAKLEDENRKLNLSYIELQSMDKLISGAKSLSLVPVANVETISTEAMALNR